VRAAIIIAAAALAAAAPAHATSFDGSCDFSGAVSFSPPMTTTPQPVAQSADARGTCNGEPARYLARSSGDAVSCAFGIASGSGRLILVNGSIRFAMTEYRGGATPLIHLVGNRGGEAWMPVTPSQSSDPVAAVQACNSGGLSSFALDAHMQTNGALRG
jgi:hypothetical protein